MKQLKDDRKTRYTKKVIKDSLMELMKEKPIAKITIKELCERADINRTTFYAHYLDQYDLLNKIEEETFAWAREMLEDLLKRSGSRNKDEMPSIIEGILEYIAQNSAYLGVLMNEQGGVDFQRQLFSTIYQQYGIRFSQSGNMQNQELYYIFVVNGSIGLIQHWLKNDIDLPPKKLAEIIYSMAVNALNQGEAQ